MQWPTFKVKSGSILHQLFEGVVYFKLIHGVLEIGVGAVVLFLNHHFVSMFLFRLSTGELLEDRADAIANYLHDTALSITHSTEIFIGAYLLTYGVIKVILALGLIFDRSWSYGFAITTLVIFIVYEVYRVSHTHSLFLFCIIVLDILTAFLIWAEHKRKRNAAALPPAQG